MEGGKGVRGGVRGYSKGVNVDVLQGFGQDVIKMDVLKGLDRVC